MNEFIKKRYKSGNMIKFLSFIKQKVYVMFIYKKVNVLKMLFIGKFFLYGIIKY